MKCARKVLTLYDARNIIRRAATDADAATRLAVLDAEAYHAAQACLWAGYCAGAEGNVFSNRGPEGLWVSVRVDAENLEAGGLSGSLALSPLWPGSAPRWATDKWATLKAELRARSTEHWDVWVDWYEARLRGEPGNEEEDIARVLEVTEDQWAAGPAVANKRIKDIVSRFTGAPHTIPSVTAKATTKARAFISHASQADGTRASALARELEAAGVSCWLAPRDIHSGADWNVSIMNAIDECDAMILLVSDAALKSSFVKAEVQHAFERSKRVFPIHLSNSIEAGQIDLRLKIIQHIDGRGETQMVATSILKSLS